MIKLSAIPASDSRVLHALSRFFFKDEGWFQPVAGHDAWHGILWTSLVVWSAWQVDNPDQRIDQDVDEFVGSTRELVFGGLGSVVRPG